MPVVPRPLEYVNDAGYEPGLLYLELGELAGHLVQLVQAGSLGELPAVFAAVERLHNDGDEFVREAATIGLLEGVQNAAGHAGVASDAFVPHLGPVSALWWRKIEKFWAGEIPFGGAGVKS